MPLALVKHSFRHGLGAERGSVRIQQQYAFRWRPSLMWWFARIPKQPLAVDPARHFSDNDGG